MAGKTTAETHQLWAKHFNGRDEKAVLELYEEEAALVARPPGTVVQGKAAVGEALKGFMAMGAVFKLDTPNVVQAEDVALVMTKWAMKATGPDGKPMETTGVTSDVLRRGRDGAWRFVVDNPWGAD